MTSYCPVEDELPKQVVDPAGWNLKGVGHIGWTCRHSKVHLERELVRPPCLLADDRAKRKPLLCNQWCVHISFYFMKGYENAYILIPAHRTDRYKRNDLEIRGYSIQIRKQYDYCQI